MQYSDIKTGRTDHDEYKTPTEASMAMRQFVDSKLVDGHFSECKQQDASEMYVQILRHLLDLEELDEDIRRQASEGAREVDSVKRVALWSGAESLREKFIIRTASARRCCTCDSITPSGEEYGTHINFSSLPGEPTTC